MHIMLTRVDHKFKKCLKETSLLIMIMVPSKFNNFKISNKFTYYILKDVSIQ